MGFKTISRLYLKDALFLLLDENNLNKYPIIKKGINLSEEDLKIIIKNNDKIFDFIKKDDEKERKKLDKITFEQYYNFLNPARRKFPSIISCGVRKGEKYIEL